jgi:hypothetical protein
MLVHLQVATSTSTGSVLTLLLKKKNWRPRTREIVIDVRYKYWSHKFYTRNATALSRSTYQNVLYRTSRDILVVCNLWLVTNYNEQMCQKCWRKEHTWRLVEKVVGVEKTRRAPTVIYSTMILYVIQVPIV